MNLKVLCASVSSFYASADLCWLTGSQTCRSFLPFALTLKNSWSDQFVSLFLFSFFFFSPILQDGPQRKKRKSEAAEVDKQLDILAIGTAVGSILLYSTVKGELQSKLVSYTLFIMCYQTVVVSVSLS